MERKRIKCCFLFHGLPRSLRWTKQNIRRNVIQPFSDLVDQSCKVAHFNNPGVVLNPRSLEHNVRVAYPNLTGLDIDIFWIESQDDNNLTDKFEVLKHHELQAETTLQSHINLLHGYHSLKRVWTMAEMAGFTDSDIFVFLRPDLDYIDPWPAATLMDTILSDRSDLICPDWHSFGGLNDRMAIANLKGAKAYASRWDMVETLVAENIPRSSEKLLLRTAELAGVRSSTFSSRALRVRADGRTQKEDFNFPISRRLLWKSRHKIAAWVSR
jgi:hypothetical protein